MFNTSAAMDAMAERITPTTVITPGLSPPPLAAGMFTTPDVAEGDGFGEEVRAAGGTCVAAEDGEACVAAEDGA